MFLWEDIMNSPLELESDRKVRPCLRTAHLYARLRDYSPFIPRSREIPYQFVPCWYFRLAEPTLEVYQQWLRQIAQDRHDHFVKVQNALDAHDHENNAEAATYGDIYTTIQTAKTSYEALAWALQREEDATHSACRSIYTDLIAGLRQYQGKEKRKSV